MEDFLTPEELAKKWKVSRVWIYRLVQQNRIPFIRVAGKVLRFHPSEIEKWMEENRGQEYHRDKT
jgi:excisionase family DNA binding protein